MFAVRYKPFWIALLFAACMFQTGCVRRRMTIHSNPPGALVYVDNYEVGTTPCSVDFIYYGTRDITLVKDGYETLKVKQKIAAPWYQIPPLDFVSENLVPNEIRDERSLTFNLSPQVIVPTDQLLTRAENLRRGTQAQVLPPTSFEPLAPPPGQPLFPGGPQTLPPGGRAVPEQLPPPPGR